MLPEKIKQVFQNLGEEQGDLKCAYLYDLSELVSHASKMREALPENCELFYAAKANPEAEILQALEPIVDGFEAASGGELKWLRQQLPEQRLIFGGPGKLDCELEAAIDLNIELLHVESLYELRRLQSIAQRKNAKVSILLRMNIPIGDINQTRLCMGGKPTPFGLEEALLTDALSVIGESTNIELKGFHFHLMSHQLDLDNHIKLMALYFETFKRWRESYAQNVTHLNVGGGIGINYSDPDNWFDWPRFCDRLSRLINDSQMQDVTIRFECGRFVSAQCGYYGMQVLDIKPSYGEIFVVARGGTHHFRTPAAQNHSHPFKIVHSRLTKEAVPRISQSRVTIVGQLCTPKDVLAKQEFVESLSVGDWIVFTYAGAYAWNISHQNFLMHEKPRVIFLD
ncbi:type III PLP-dependent enzyme [Aliikangiella sp. G2MR2-5]|uniref:type III PLP-dependent enzyme n=1 Tax=Aliikangiella sp. G2MR2-5 TaxID=2788943 RepID=UPI0018A9CB4A|nr:type III PLP-dependent enzyme [Aliikangiella sp. G2MR2-5]